MRYFRLPFINPEWIKINSYFLLFETALFDKDNFKSYIFFNPIKVIKINSSGRLKEAFEMIERYAKRYYLAGYFAYELGYYFEKELFNPDPISGYPLIHLCVFDNVISFDHRTGRLNKRIPNLFKEVSEEKEFQIKNLKIGFRKKDYIKKIKCIKQYIKKGDTYQVNFTTKFHFNFWGCPFSFYNDLKNRQNVSYASFCKFKDEYIVSLSPELFFKRQGEKIYSKPMKGTIRRGINIYEDKIKALTLKENQKDRAENLMIVDLIRNDLGRISKIGSIKVNRLFDIERYNTLFQMTSTVEGRLKKGITYFDIFKSLFPGGSVT
ncbi:MAG: chorismate-binding protein, partial [Candidatus Omnitrophica bacterium]|nr:chorismate-binding protein [Candidatus Omnitrophota bacterium]